MAHTPTVGDLADYAEVCATMLHYWLSVFIKGFWDSLTFVNQTKSGIAFVLLTAAFTFLLMWAQHGWSGAVKQVIIKFGELALMGAGASYLVILFFTLVFEPYHLQSDEQTRTRNAIGELDSKSADYRQCISGINIELMKSGLLQSNITSQGSLVNSQQAMLNNQQAAINSCFVSLGKMNPMVNRNIAVLHLPAAKRTEPGLFGKIIYISEMVITTNHFGNPVGTIKCDKPFTPRSTPTVPIVASVAVEASSLAIPISDREYQIRVSNTGGEWGPNGPIYFVVESAFEQLGACTF